MAVGVPGERADRAGDDYLACTTLRETNKERMKPDATGAILATLACTAAVFAFDRS